MNIKIILIALGSLLIVAGCGGGGGGSVSNATINANNERSLAIAATEGAKSASLVNFSSALSLRPAANGNALNFTEQLATRIAATHSTADYCASGGSAHENINASGNGSVIFSNCNFGGVIANGTLSVSVTEGSSTTTISLSFNNFSLTVASEVIEFSMSTTCTINNSPPSSISCSYESSFAGIDGRVYDISEISVTGNEFSGYTISATIIDPDHGRIRITTTDPVILDCPSGQPSSGQIQFTDDSGVLVTINFDSCASFTISYSGSATTYDW